MVAVFSAVNPRFFSLAAAANILQDFSPVMLMAIGQTFVIATGGSTFPLVRCSGFPE